MKKKTNNSNQTWDLNKLEAQLGETKLKIALLKAAQLEEEEAQSQVISSLGNVQLTDLSPKEKTLVSIRHEIRKNTSVDLLKILSGVMKVAAALFLVGLIGFGTAIAISSDVRVEVMKLLYKITPEYTEISLVNDDDASFYMPEGWKGDYYPSYIPDGYIFDSFQGDNAIATATYTSMDGKILRFSESTGTTEMNVDTEDYMIENIFLNGSEALLAYKEGSSRIVWKHGNKILMVRTSDTVQSAIDIALSVVSIK